MLIQGLFYNQQSIDNQIFQDAKTVYFNLPTPLLIEEALNRCEVRLTEFGSIIAYTGKFTGRAAKDKFTVNDPAYADEIWFHDNNKPLSREHFNGLQNKITQYYQERDLFVLDCFAGADPEFRVPIRIVTPSAWHALFARYLFIQPSPNELVSMLPEATVLHAPDVHADPATDGTRTDTFIVSDYTQKIILIGGTEYAGEVKKSIFTLMNFLLPRQGVLSMHCSANVGDDGDVAVLFGLSGTGKTTLATNATRRLIGDDEHGWSSKGVFNLEGGCYAKVIRLSEKDEPEIFGTTRRFGTILENVCSDSNTGAIDLDCDEFTENTRAAYPLVYMDRYNGTGVGEQPENIIMLTADAFGVMPPIARLTTDQARYYFLSGYTAKVAGTEKGVTEPQATFSTCFGAPFMVLKPSVYARLLGEKINTQKVNVWLINTGWTGGPYGVGQRMKIAYTRTMVDAALRGKLDQVDYVTDPNFGIAIPVECPGVPSEVLNPRNTWADKDAYDVQVRKLVNMFKDNFNKYTDHEAPEVSAAGPR